ncbi:lytic transglycosylase domain-containing protein, partial [Pseudoalteromonas sp. Of7M-16]|uniref:lytic transglycosylase domain-containing protein n=1 Tax=Pseudoalteromonas sp. Of7M-16 TaxID=2917756 RepID=UPI0023B7B756
FLVLGCLVFAILPEECWASGSRYDSKIKAAWRRYLPDYHWGLGWAQLWQESRLKPDARSPVGAEGIGQFMPGTWADMQRLKVVPAGTSVRNAAYNIQAAGAYMGMQLAGWQSQGRTSGSRYDLAAAGYNAGRGHLYKAQHLCDNKMEYAQIISCLPQVTGHHSSETIEYVRKIHHWYELRFGRSLWW